jgi:hypothetical protein
MGSGVVVNDLEVERSVVNLTPPKISHAIRNLPVNYFTMKERELKRQAKPDHVDSAIRMRFWGEYYQAQDEKRNMSIDHITFGVCSRDYLYGTVLDQPYLLAWIVRPPPDLSVQQTDTLTASLIYQRQVLDEIMENQLYLNKKVVKDKNTGKERTEVKLNVQALTEIRKISESLSLRVQGAIIQKLAVDQRHTHRMSNGQIGETTGIVEMDSPMLPESDLDQLKSLDRSLSRLNKTLDKSEDVIDAEEVPVDGSLPDVPGQQDEAGESPGDKEERPVCEDGVKVEAHGVDSPDF